jgi:hypothetical protein
MIIDFIHTAFTADWLPAIIGPKAGGKQANLTRSRPLWKDRFQQVPSGPAFAGPRFGTTTTPPDWRVDLPASMGKNHRLKTFALHPTVDCGKL